MYQSFKTFLFRTPYFPFSALQDFKTKQQESVFREMLQIATPDLSEGIGNGNGKGKKSCFIFFYKKSCIFINHNVYLRFINPIRFCAITLIFNALQ